MSDFLKGIIDGINSVLGNYGWSIMVFTLMIRVILLPFDYKSRVGMRRMSDVQPKMAELQKKYGKDREKLNQKMSELYKKERVSPLSGCLPMLLSYPILIAMFAAMRLIANEQVVQQVISILQNPSHLPQFEGWLWVHNIWMPDSPFSSTMPDLNTIRQVPSDVWLRYITPEILSTLPSELSHLTMDSFTQANLNGTITELFTVLTSMPVYETATAIVPGWTFNLLITQFSVMQLRNGYFLLPILSAVSQFVMTKLQPQQSTAPSPNGNGQANMTGKFMTYFFPLFSLWICSNYNGAFALYWVTSNLIAMLENYLINLYLDKKKAKASAIKTEASVR